MERTVRSNHNAIFVGITPSSDPEYVAAIIIRDPKKEIPQEVKMQHQFSENL